MRYPATMTATYREGIETWERLYGPLKTDPAGIGLMFELAETDDEPVNLDVLEPTFRLNWLLDMIGEMDQR